MLHPKTTKTEEEQRGILRQINHPGNVVQFSPSSSKNEMSRVMSTQEVIVKHSKKAAAVNT